MNCPRCDKEMGVHYTRQANYRCECGFNFKEHQYELYYDECFLRMNRILTELNTLRKENLNNAKSFLKQIREYEREIELLNIALSKIKKDFNDLKGLIYYGAI